jgi:uroporphyrinogen III methyltransferase/synthase
MVVYIVGAGPGDIELLTLKAKRLIENAEIIIYDKLINKDILNWASANCKIIYVGKREKGTESSQEIQKEINILIQKYGHVKKVVRLKGGDPFIFGRGGEEAQICAKHKIPFEISPGISAAFAVPAYAGIPVSHRDFNSSFAVVTGHESDKNKPAIYWENLPETLIILMGVKKIKDTAKKLLSVGRDPTTPVAAIYNGTTANQKTKFTNLKRLAEEGISFTPPVIFVVGPIASLKDELNWFEKKLSTVKGKKVVLTRAKTHQKESKSLFKTYGMEIITMPLIEIVPKEFNIPNIKDFDALVFTSVEGVKQVIKKVNLDSFNGYIYAIGPKTKKMLSELNPNVTIGEKYNSEGLAEHIINNLDEGSRILTLRSSAATNTLKNKLSSKFKVTEKHVYDIKRLPADPEKIKKGDVIFVVSASCAKSLAELKSSIYKGKTMVSIGPETSRHIPFPHITASNHTVQGMIDIYLDYLWTGSK